MEANEIVKKSYIAHNSKTTYRIDIISYDDAGNVIELFRRLMRKEPDMTLPEGRLSYSQYMTVSLSMDTLCRKYYKGTDAKSKLHGDDTDE